MGGQMDDHAERGCSVFEGPHHKWTWRYYFNMPGSEYFSLYLWLIKVGRDAGVRAALRGVWVQRTSDRSRCSLRCCSLLLAP